MECVAAKRGLTSVKGYHSIINVANIDKIYGRRGYWDSTLNKGRYISTFRVENFLLKLFGKKPKKPKRWTELFHGYRRPMLCIVMSGEHHYYYFDKNSELYAEHNRIVDMMR